VLGRVKSISHWSGIQDSIKPLYQNRNTLSKEGRFSGVSKFRSWTTTHEGFFLSSIEFRVKEPEYRVTKPEYRVEKRRVRVRVATIVGYAVLLQTISYLNRDMGSVWIRWFCDSILGFFFDSIFETQWKVNLGQDFPYTSHGNVLTS